MPTNLDALIDIAARDTAPRPQTTPIKETHRRNASGSSTAFDRAVDDLRKQEAYKQDLIDDQRRSDAAQSARADKKDTHKTAAGTSAPSAPDDAIHADSTITEPASQAPETPIGTTQGEPQPPESGNTIAQTQSGDQTTATQTSTAQTEKVSSAAISNASDATDTDIAGSPSAPAQTATTPVGKAAQQAQQTPALPEHAAAAAQAHRPEKTDTTGQTGNPAPSPNADLAAGSQPVGNAPVGTTAQTVSTLMEKTGGAVENALHAHSANTHPAKQTQGIAATAVETEDEATGGASGAVGSAETAPDENQGNAKTAQSTVTASAADTEAADNQANDKAAISDTAATAPLSQPAEDQDTAAQTPPQQDAPAAAPAQTAGDGQQASTAQAVAGQHDDSRKAEIKSGTPAHTLSNHTNQDKAAPGATAANAGTHNGANTGGGTNTGGQSASAQSQAANQPQQPSSADGQQTSAAPDTPSRLSELIAARHAPEQTGKPVEAQSAHPILDDTPDAPAAAKIETLAAAKSAPAHGLRLSNAQAHQVQSQVAVHIASQVKNGASKFEMRLDPPELGRIEVQLNIAKDGKVKAMLSADHQDTLDLLQRDQKFLQKALSDAGLNLDNDGLTFSLNDHAQSGYQQANENATEQPGASSTLAVETTDTGIPDLTEFRVTESYGIRLAHRLGVNIAV